MDEQKQQQLRELAEYMVSASDPNQHTLAAGTLELLHYVDELVHALEDTTESCFEVMSVLYDHAEIVA
jgi:hypothetical protein